MHNYWKAYQRAQRDRRQAFVPRAKILGRVAPCHDVFHRSGRSRLRESSAEQAQWQPYQTVALAARSFRHRETFLGTNAHLAVEHAPENRVRVRLLHRRPTTHVSFGHVFQTA